MQKSICAPKKGKNVNRLVCLTGQKLELKDIPREVPWKSQELWAGTLNGYIRGLRQETQIELPQGLKQSFVLLYSLRLDLYDPNG